MDSKPVVIGRWGIFLSLLLVFLLGGGLMALVAIADGREAKSAAPPMPMALGANAANTPAIQGALSVGFASIVKPALPAVVNISSTKVTRTSDMGSNPFFSNPFFRQFFGDDLFRGFHMPRNQREKSLGSGVVVSPDGYILTNNHVVDGATDIQVFLNDKREFKARVIGRDPRTDIAVLKINATGLPVLPLGDSSKMQVGDVVLAIGDPFGVGETVTMGIVSATGRGHLDIEDYEDFIQTDAAINPGNSGGALMNSRGELIGINTAIISGGGGNQGVGFAIPINMANKVMQQIRTHGKVIRGYLGVTIQDVTSELQKAFGLRQTTGALVGDVSPNGPAARAGITKGDVILSLDGQSVADANSFKLRVGEIAPGSHATLRIMRNGSEREVAVTLGEFPEKSEESPKGDRESGTVEGIQVDDLTPEVAQQLGLPSDTRGVVITDVAPDSTAAEAGLRRGDVIQEINRKPVKNLEDYGRIVRTIGTGEVLLLINRGGTTSFVVVQPR